MPLRIVILDTDLRTHSAISAAAQRDGHEARAFTRMDQAEVHVANFPVDLLILNVNGGGPAGFEFLRRCRANRPQLHSVVITDLLNVEVAAHSVAEGALDCLEKPLEAADLQRILRQVDEHKLGAATAPAVEVLPQTAIVGRSPKMREVFKAIARVSRSSESVLIVGPRGTGKELVARTIHEHSKRSGKPFTPVNCGSFTEPRLESTVFGWERRFSAEDDEGGKGLIENSDGGTLYLDEITETPLSFQTQLLRVITEQQVRRVGSNRPVPVDVRVIAATNQDVRRLIESGSFRQDLHSRLSVAEITLPTLDERREDIPMLAQYFLQKFNASNERHVTIEIEAVRLLQSQQWPGNVRELENSLYRLALFAPTARITAVDVHQEQIQRTSIPVAPAAGKSPEKLVEVERRQILRVLQEVSGNKSEAARRLGIQRKTLYKKANRLGISLEPSKYRPNKNA